MPRKQMSDSRKGKVTNKGKAQDRMTTVMMEMLPGSRLSASEKACTSYSDLRSLSWHLIGKPGS